ncbi:EDD domain protein, DegV family [Sporobacter termitidis DSM 10068]|uniref:EDD domain protein, DegV family n=1 Tax=Sporobacter termitidis DSM 10068 TaxID=1123282 RepID=A0A1M5YEL5_9FIRM|nr:DegV family protein [Sporobacter termitidis]SHI10501.1 EDD domain protein, DegV family [Sporobacter termitidis DSM 10068]
MTNYKITCSSTADLPRSYFESKDIPYVCYHFEMDGKLYPDDLGKTVPFKEFYDRIDAGAMPVTSQVNVEEFKKFFEPVLAEGMDLLHIEMSSGISGTFNCARIAREELMEKYPDRKFYLVDSLGASSGFGLLVDTAWDMKNSGRPAEEVYGWLEENKLKLHHWFFSTDLKHYKRGGRISATSAALGTLLNICPLMNMNDKGELIPREKIRGKKHVIREIVEKMKAHAQNGAAYSGKCFVSNSACPEDAQAVAALVEAEFRHLSGKVMVNDIGTVVGSHTGPGTVALFFWGDERVD